MSDVYVVESLRTPFGSFGGGLADIPATELAATVIENIIERTGITGENMSMAPYAMPKGRYGARMGNAEFVDLMTNDALVDAYSGNTMGLLTEGSAARHDITRKEQDKMTARSYMLGQKALEEGLLTEELISICKKTRKGTVTIDQDEDPFRGNVAKLPTLRTVFKKDGTITAGNASTISDGAAVTLLASTKAVAKHNLKPVARIVAYASSSIDPDYFAEAPVHAIEKVLKKAGLSIKDIDLFEINEAFDAVPLMAAKVHNIDLDKVNVNGGACAFGHPVGASGGRFVATLIREMKVRKARYGLATLCIGGGEAVAIIFELVQTGE